LREEFNIPFLWEYKCYGVNFTFLEKYYENLEKFQPSDYYQEWIEAAAVKQFLCKPEPVLSFDLNTMNSANEIPQTIEIEKQILEPGMFDGFCLYFNAIFDNEINLNTSPFSEYTHWGNCLFRIETRAVYGGEKVRYKISMPDLLNITTWRVSIQKFK
jgi:protein arginine N-methyltransferase 1